MLIAQVKYIIYGISVVFLILEVIAYLLTIPFLRKAKVGQSIRKEGPERHLQKAGTPTMGGSLIIIFASMIALISIFWLNLAIDRWQLALIAIAFLGYGLLGFIDDYLIIVKQVNDGIRPSIKFLCQLLIAAIMYGVLILSSHDSSLNIFGVNVNLYFGYGIFLLLLLVGTSNAVNISDGIDGLAGGLLTINFASFSLIAYYQSNWPVFVICLALVVTILGFLIFNVYPAKIFMGNTGSLALGAILATISICLECEVLLLIIGIPFVIETISVILQVIYFKATHGKRLFKMAPIHHHLELSGYTEWQIDLIFWSFNIVMGILGVIMGVRLF